MSPAVALRPPPPACSRPTDAARAGPATGEDGHRDGTVYIVDDDASMRSALSGLLRSASLASEPFASAADFLRTPEPQGPACIVLDMRLSHSSGFDVQDAIRQRRRRLPVVFLTGYGTIAMTVRAMKAGAAAFLTKPFADDELLDAIGDALQRDREAIRVHAEHDALLARHQRLTPRERQVMALVVAGLLNKQVAAQLGTSEITVKVHRRQVMTKMQADSLPDLVRMSERLAAIARGGV